MTHLVEHYGLLFLFGIIALESAGAWVPGETALVTAAVLASQGHLEIEFVILVAAFAAILGDNIGYWIGARGGRRVVHRFGRYIFLTPERLHRAEKFFARRGNRIVLAARFIDGLRQFNGVIAGISAMPWRTFLLYNAIGAALWVGWWTTISYVLGTHLVEILEHTQKYKWWALVGIALCVALYAILHVRHVRKRRAREAAESTPEVEKSPR